MERREAPAFSKRERGKTEDWCATRCSIPSFYEGERLVRRSPQGEGGGRRRARRRKKSGRRSVG